ncbi:uncharacterized protein [Hetaerina americana]|uniref:uncharacterized protein n=1 Tax=Hetaerina americana TaxID=62018 RepID=UPI003A7F5EF5
MAGRGEGVVGQGVGGAVAPGDEGGVMSSEPQLVEAASQFVSEVIERAKEEMSRRQAAAAHEGARAEADSGAGVDDGRKAAPPPRGIGGPLPWHSRARGLLTRLLTSFCFRGGTTLRSDIPRSS